MSAEHIADAVTEQPETLKNKTLYEQQRLVMLSVIKSGVSIQVAISSLTDLGLTFEASRSTFYGLQSDGLVDLDSHFRPIITGNGEVYLADHAPDEQLLEYIDATYEVVAAHEVRRKIGEKIVESAHLSAGRPVK